MSVGGIFSATRSFRRAGLELQQQRVGEEELLVPHTGWSALSPLGKRFPTQCSLLMARPLLLGSQGELPLAPCSRT